MNLLESLQTHTELCEEIYDLMIEENRTLRRSGKAPPDELLNRKSALLGTISFSLERLRGSIGESIPATPEIRARVQKAQQTILKALLLDRENEQLLLKSSVRPRAEFSEPRPPASRMKQAYTRAAA